MSTKGSIYYDGNIHLYEEMLGDGENDIGLLMNVGQEHFNRDKFAEMCREYLKWYCRSAHAIDPEAARARLLALRAFVQAIE